MNEYDKAFLDGLYAAAMICQDKAKDRNSHYSEAIMSFHTKHKLKLEQKRNDAIKNQPPHYASRNKHSPCIPH